MTRPELRDTMILRLGRARGASVGLPIGTPHPSDPWPTIDDYNLFINEAVMEINRRCITDSNGVPQSLTVAAQTQNGPLAIDISGGMGTFAAGEIEDVYEAWWDSGTASPNWPMEHVSADSIRRDWSQWFGEAPSQPTYFWIDGNNLMVFPSPSTGGTLWMIFTYCIPRLFSDAASVRELPVKLHPVVAVIAARIAAQTRPRDVELQAVAAGLETEGEKGVLDIMRWHSARVGGEAPGMTPFNRRQW